MKNFLNDVSNNPKLKSNLEDAVNSVIEKVAKEHGHDISNRDPKTYANGSNPLLKGTVSITWTCACC
ncbi:MAG: hypothetical protein WBG46_04110 [Nonlabens sp.]